MVSTVPEFLPRWRVPGPGPSLSRSAAVHGGPPAARKALLEALRACGEEGARAIQLIRDVPPVIRDKVGAAFGVPFGGDPEAYAVEALDDEVCVYAAGDRGLLYGAFALGRLLEGSAIATTLAYDCPLCAVRGIKIYLPAPKDIDYFKCVIDMAAYYKYNTVVIEVGGAMEYRRHPEVNEGWEAYCAEMNRYSDRSKEIQECTFGWKKNSIHAENGGGKALSQDTVRELVDYCREMQIDVIPEMPSLSHCDYLLTRHPEIREREEDPYPDTYCPSNHASYALLFDLLDEVIDVFRPKMMHIGHDEYYSIGLCPQCRGRDAAEIYADDIRRIHGSLAERGIRTMIWGDKLLDAWLAGYGPCGGARIETHHPATGEVTGIIPPTHRAIDLMPCDLIIMHWYWGVDSRLEQQFHDRGLETVFGNFSAAEIPHWNERIAKGVRGAVISNWSALRRDNLQRNGFFYNLAYASIMSWTPACADGEHTERNRAVLRELLRYRIERETAGKMLPDGPEALLEILHNTDLDQPYSDFVDGTFVDRERDTLGQYILTYTDAREARIPVVYGHNISGSAVSWERTLQSETTVWQMDKRLQEAAYTTCPVLLEGETWYRYICPNPRPGYIPAAVRIEQKRKDCTVRLRSIACIGLPSGETAWLRNGG